MNWRTPGILAGGFAIAALITLAAQCISGNGQTQRPTPTPSPAPATGTPIGPPKPSVTATPTGAPTMTATPPPATETPSPTPPPPETPSATPQLPNTGTGGYKQSGGCQTGACGPLLPPAVAVVYTSLQADHYDAAFYLIATGGYMDLLPGMGRVAWRDSVIMPLPDGYLSLDRLQQVMEALPAGALTVFVLGPGQHGDFVPYAFHHESPAGRFAVLPYRASEEWTAFDFAHELVEGLTDSEIVDPCAYDWRQYGPLILQSYLVDGQCQIGQFSRP